MGGDLARYAAVNARVRALAASLLGRRGLEALYGYPSPEAMRDALAAAAYGAPAEAEAAPGAARPWLARLARVGRTVLATMDGPEAAFVHHYLLWHEVGNLEIVIRVVAHRHAWSEVARHVVPLPGIATIDPESLAGADGPADLAGRLAGTRYAAPLRRALQRGGEPRPFALEVALELSHYGDLWARAATLLPADARRVRALVGLLFDILNLGWIARHRGVLDLSPEDTLALTLPHGRWLTSRMLDALARDPGRPWGSVLARTPYASLLAETDAGTFDAACPGLWRLLAVEVRRSLGGYPFHLGVPLGLLMAQELEIRDIEVLLAAKGLGVAADDALAAVATVRS